MTDEEIKEMEKEAKEYAQGNFYSEQGFLYGYERGFEEGRKEKWHDLRKDPDDLPEEDCTEVMFVTKNNETLTGIYKNGGGEGTPIFDTFGIAFYDVEQVIAWCELPKFKE